MFERLVEPDLSWFSELHVGAFFGRTVDLSTDWLGFTFSTPGTYTVQTTLTTGARQWLDSWLKRNRKDPQRLPFSYAHVFGGTLVAAPVAVVISE
jgi:hypothetical protein